MRRIHPVSTTFVDGALECRKFSHVLGVKIELDDGVTFVRASDGAMAMREAGVERFAFCPSCGVDVRFIALGMTLYGPHGKSVSVTPAVSAA